MNRYHLMLICILVITGSCLIGLSRSEPTDGHGAVHPEFESMSHGGVASRHKGLLLIGWIYGGSQIGFLILWMKTACRGRHGSSLYIMGFAYLAVFTALMVSYANQQGGETPTIVFGYPSTTTWLVFGMWPTGFGFVVFYASCFRRWIYDDESRIRFEQVLAHHRGQMRQRSSEEYRDG